jgi:hypothetical protein
MRVVGWLIGLVALLLGALWFFTRGEPAVEPAATPATTSAPVAVTTPEATRSEPVAAAVEPEEPAPESPPGGLPKCRPTLTSGEGPPLELTLTGAALPDAPPKPLKLEVRWTEEGQPRRWFVQLRHWKTTFWLCDESEIAIRRGPYRLRSTRVPREGAPSLFLEEAPTPSEVTVRTVRRGAPIAGVHVSVTGCEPLATDDGGVAVTSCEEVEEPRRAVVRAPWRAASPVLVPAAAVELTVPVLGRDEVEPGRVGLGFSRSASTPSVSTLLDDSPAQRAGVRVGDEVLEVNGVGVSSVADAMRLIVGEPGSTVRLKLRRGVDVLLIDVVRAPP